MTRFIFRWSGGVAFVLSLMTAAYMYVWPFERGRPWNGWIAVFFDAAIFSVFALHHSLFARAGAKAAMAALVPEPLLRSVYVWIASLLLIGVGVLWRPVGGLLYHTTGCPAAVHVIVQVAGVCLIVWSVRAIDPLELAGIHTAPADSSALVFSGAYHLVRHPLYLGWILIVFGAARMTGDRFTFAAVSTCYLLIAIPWEERSLEDTFGDAYRHYRTQVRWRVVPYIY